jgi:phospholipase C
MKRRQFLRAAGLVGGAAMLGGPGLLACSDGSSPSGPSATNVPRLPLPPDSVLANAATECPIDTVVVLTMENRSFDHYLGWLATDEQYRDEGRRRYGKRFRVNARLDETYLNPFDVRVPTRHALDLGDDPSPYRGCNHKDPGHSWTAGRVQRDFVFSPKARATTTSRPATTSPVTSPCTRTSRGPSPSWTGITLPCSVRPSRTASTCAPRPRRA